MSEPTPKTPTAGQDGGDSELTKTLQDIERGFENSWDEEEYLHTKGVLAKMLDQQNEKRRSACEERAEAVTNAMLWSVKVHNLALRADLWRDEFLRIKALSPGPEIEGLCDRAISDITQRFDLIQQRDKAEKERDNLAAHLTALREELSATVDLARDLGKERDALRAENAELKKVGLELLNIVAQNNIQISSSWYEETIKRFET